jgi:colanic acid/amylovoran biosynthesis glycosyltransferase
MEELMRIAFLVHRFPELSETFIVNQATGLIEAGHEVDVYAARAGKGSKVHADIHRYRLLERTHYWSMPRSYLVRSIKAVGVIGRTWRRPDVLLRALDVRGRGRQALSLGVLYTSATVLKQRKAYDIVHCQFGTLGRTALALQDVGVTDGRLVVSFRGSDLTSGGRDRSYEEMFQRGHLFLPVCERLRQQLISRGCDAQKIRVHHSGIKLSRFAYTGRRPAVSGPTRLLTIARLVEKKGVAYAIEAIGRLKASGRDVHYTVAGDGPQRSDLDRMIDELDLGEQVKLVGPKSQEEVIALLQDAHLFVTPSVTAASGDQEGIPNVLKEAMAMGIPVVSTRHSGIPELVQDGVSGLLAPERDSEALAERLACLIDHPEKWAAMGRAGRQHVESEFDSDKLNKELVDLYLQVISNDRSPLRVVP